MALHDESEMTILNNRNIKALNEALKLERKRVDELIKKVDGYTRTVATLNEEIAQLRAMIATMMNMR